MLLKIVVIGPESTGKSMLSEQLAAHYGTGWCREYAREYLLKHGMNYSYDDLLTIAKGQIAEEDTFINAQGSVINTSGSKDSPSGDARIPVFIDTDMYVMKVWCEFVFDNCHRFILDEIVRRQYDLYLLCNIDLVWVKDQLREYPDLESRRKLYAIYKDILVNQSVPWVEVSGSFDERFRVAREAVDRLIKQP
jgi:NadR type nicotinamide-nucleotide adenylyltransferase